MSTLSDVRDGIKTTVKAAISGLEVYTYEPDNPMDYPCLVLEETGEINYLLTFGDKAEFEMSATLYLHTAKAADGWAAIDDYRSATGSKSIRAAIASDRTLNSKANTTIVVDSARAQRAREERFFEFSCVFTIRIMVNG